MLGGYELEMTKILSEMDYVFWAYVLGINWLFSGFGEIFGSVFS